MSTITAEISQKQIAKRLGLSAMTVSRALRGGDGISSETRMKVLAAARENGLPVSAPSEYRNSKTLLNVLCTMAPESRGRDSDFHRRLLAGLARGGRECGSEIVNTPEFPRQNNEFVWPLIVLRKQVDGAVMVWGNEHDPRPATPCPVPIVFIFYGPPHRDVVTTDNFSGGFELGQYLAERGHRSVAFVGPDSRTALERLAGLRAGLETLSGTVLNHLAFTQRGGGGTYPHADKLLERAKSAGESGLGFTAVMAYNDYIGARLIHRFTELGIRVPDDVSVVGFDGISPNDYTGPKITTCAVPVEELGAEAARLVYWRLEHPTAVRRRLSLDGELVEGETVATVGTETK